MMNTPNAQKQLIYKWLHLEKMTHDTRKRHNYHLLPIFNLCYFIWLFYDRQNFGDDGVYSMFVIDPRVG